MPHDLHFEDFRPGQKFESGGITLTEAEIIDFALRYDPQPFHIDVEAAKASHFGGLIASGFHTLALAYRMLYQTGFLASAHLGGPGLDDVRWLRPARPGDTLRTVAEVTDVKPSSSKPDRGALKLAVTARNQRGESVLSATFLIIVGRRNG
ncbi:MAG: MaoC family dehydratase [Pseudomonadota bacterium]